MLTRLFAFLRLTSSLRLRAWVIATLTRRIDIDVGWVLSEDRQSVHFELYLRKRGGNPYLPFDAAIVTRDVPVKGSLTEWALLGFNLDIDWHAHAGQSVLGVRDFIQERPSRGGL